MAAILKNLSGKTWGLSSESANGISAKSFDQKAGSEIFKHKDEQGETSGKVFYDFSQSGTLTGATTAAPSVDVADPVTLANEIATLGGVAGGTTLVTSVAVKKGNDILQEITVEFERHPTLTTT